MSEIVVTGHPNPDVLRAMLESVFNYLLEQTQAVEQAHKTGADTYELVTA